MDNRRRAQEALVEEWREQEKRRRDNNENKWVSVVLDMEAGISYLQTTYP